MSRWFRMYDELLDDPKVQRLRADDFRGWVNLLCLASRNGGKLPPLADIAFALRETLEAVSTLVERLRSGGLIERRSGGADGAFDAPYKWAERQYKSDTSTDRVKRFRQRSKTVTETPPETEAETEKNKPKGLQKKRRPIPDDWQPSEFSIGSESRKVVDSWPPGELPAQLEQFKALHRSKRNTFLDPQDAWSTWVLNTRKWGIGKNDRPNANSLSEAVTRILRECPSDDGTGEDAGAGGPVIHDNRAAGIMAPRRIGRS